MLATLNQLNNRSAVPSLRGTTNTTAGGLLLPSSNLLPSSRRLQRSKSVGEESEEEPLLENGFAHPQLQPNGQSEVAKLVRSEVQAQIKPLRDEVARLSCRVSQLEALGFTDRDTDVGDKEIATSLARTPICLPEALPEGGNDGRCDEATWLKYVEIVKHATEYYDMKADTWGAMSYIIIKDLPLFLNGSINLEHMIRASMVLVSFSLNVFFQLKLVWWIGTQVLPHKIHEVQDTYKQFHMVSFNAGNFDPAGFELLGDERNDLCSMALGSTYFLIGCLFLWVTRTCVEVKYIYHRMRHWDILPPLPSGMSSRHMTYESGDRQLVVCFNRATRYAHYILILVPRCVVLLSLTGLGMSFLTATHDFEDLVLNSVALEFVYDIDELFMVFLPNYFAERVMNVRYAAPSEAERRHRTADRNFRRLKIEEIYARTASLLVLAILAVGLWLRFQPIIPGFEWDVVSSCKGYLASTNLIPCPQWKTDCFPKS